MKSKLVIVCIVAVALLFIIRTNRKSGGLSKLSAGLHVPIIPPDSVTWKPPDSTTIPNTKEKTLILHGKELVTNTSFFLGPKGKVKAISNGMNCQNCHLQAGTAPWGNNYSAVASTYPKFRPRSGTVESIAKRVNDCLERSLNGEALDSNSFEMQSFVSYIRWVGSNVPKGVKPAGSGIISIPYLDRPTNPGKGEHVYLLKCGRCHGLDGAGKMNPEKTGYIYPPLWGPRSYNQGAGLYRLSRLAGYVKQNMPFGTTYKKPELTDEEAWDVAAFVNSQPRPQKSYPHDWPDISKKPVDYPFGPYYDSFSEKQHKYGPFAVIEKSSRKTKEGIH
jgi:thiosulfate dehydrogenase